MVNTIILSRYKGTPPLTDENQDRKIPGGPLYSADELLPLLSNVDNVSAITARCQRDMQSYDLGNEDALEFIHLALEGNARFLGSEWCSNGKPNVWIACDAYKVSREEFSDVLRDDQKIDYYIKFALGKNGKIILIVSCHLSQ